MRERIAIIGTIALVLVVLAALNAASYVRVDEQPDTESRPDRSTANVGASGTRALHDFLVGAGHEVVRWREPPSALLRETVTPPATFVVVGELRRPFEGDEAKSLLRWVERGGRLVVIDRMPNPALLPAAGGWRVTSEFGETPGGDSWSDDAEALTAGVPPQSPMQPTLLTRDIERVAPSRFAGRLVLYPNGAGESDDEHDSSQADASPTPTDFWGEIFGEEPRPTEPPPPKPAPSPGATPVVVAPESTAPENTAPATAPTPALGPVAHFRVGSADTGGALLVDYVHGAGRIIVLSDPFIVANGGISRADNLQLALNIITGAPGVIAFDEFHQGRAASQNYVIAYFAGTPVLAMCAQLAVVVLAVLWSKGRRFARPLPAARVDRRSKLEFVASMAELQQRAHAYDLAIENIYSRTRRALARYGGAASNAPPAELAARVAARSGKDPRPVETLLRECEDAIAGEPLSPRKAQTLAARLRELERELGIRMRAREIRQAGKK